MPDSTPQPAVNLFDFERLARERLPNMAYEYIVGGAADEITLQRNRRCFDEILLEPRVLRDVGRVDLSLELLGQTLSHPILLAPTAYHKLFHPDGELESARGAAAANATMVVSTFATVAIEELAEAASGALWFQLYVHPDPEITRDLVQRAEAAGCRALCITVDTPVVGQREHERRVGFALPPELQLANLEKPGSPSAHSAHLSAGGIYTDILDPTLDWDAVERIRSWTGLPIVLKGVLSPADARIAEDAGIDGLIVSNHGARNLDTVPSSIEALPRVMEALRGETAVLLDGGVRRGTDVVKALAYGAKAVLIGRPYLWALAAEGAQGVQRAVEMLRVELETAMVLIGRRSLADIDRSVLWERA